MANNAKIRLFVDAELIEGQSVSLDQKQAHYLKSVMRQTEGENILMFNGRDGEWVATITSLSKKSALVDCCNQSRQQVNPPDLWLLFAPIKKTRTDFIVEKATELGVSKIVPVLTEYTNSTRINRDRLQAHVIEAAEQCDGLFVPTVEPLMTLRQALDSWLLDRHLLFCDEMSKTNEKLCKDDAMSTKGAVLVGPEGGFSAEERVLISAKDYSQVLSLGPRILRADPAAVSAITLWQSMFGDWK